jgi:hypothetical protein
MLTATCAKELRDTPIKVNAASPGYTATGFNGHRGSARPRGSRAELLPRHLAGRRPERNRPSKAPRTHPADGGTRPSRNRLICAVTCATPGWGEDGRGRRVRRGGAGQRGLYRPVDETRTRAGRTLRRCAGCPAGLVVFQWPSRRTGQARRQPRRRHENRSGHQGRDHQTFTGKVAESTSASVTVSDPASTSRTRASPPLCAGYWLEVDHEADAQIGHSVRPGADGGTERSLFCVLADWSAQRGSRPNAFSGGGMIATCRWRMGGWLW